jgi:amino acid adenylation domain-containing protein
MSEGSFEGFRLSPQQLRLWHLCRAGEASAYRSQCAALIEGQIDSGRLQTAVHRVIARHEILRTSLRSLETLNLPVQIISATADAEIQEVDLSALSEPQQIGALERLYERNRRARSDCWDKSAMEVMLARVAPNRQVLVVSTSSLWSDKKGLKNVIQDVIGEYQGKAGDGAPEAQYADVSEIFNELIESEAAKIGKEYWARRAMEKARLVSEIDGKTRFEPDLERLEMNTELRSMVKGLCEDLGVEESVALLSLFGVMLSRMNNAREVTVGVGYDGRTFEGLREAVGVYARYLPIEIALTEGPTFRNLVESIGGPAREFYKWQSYFDWRQYLVSNDGCDRESYFPYLFEYEVEEPKYSSAAITYGIKRQYACIDRFKVKLVCYSSDDTLTTEFHYDSALYDRAGIRRLADHYLTLLQSAVLDVRQSVDRLEILSAWQRSMILHEFNQTRREYGLDRCVHELIQEQVSRSPEAIAAVYDQEALSYRELNARANRLANYLRRRGVGPEQVVGVMIDRSIEMVIGLLGVMKAGAAYLPLDANYPASRLAYILEDAGVTWLLTERRSADHLPSHNGKKIFLDRDWEIISRESDANPARQISPRNLVYVIYTSGSTGNPKGAMLTHTGIVNCLRWMQETYLLDATDRFLMRTSLNFDPSVWELFWTLWAGAAVVLADPQRHADTAYLRRLIAEREITSAYFVPSMLRAFLDEPELEMRRSLRRVICGGESLSSKTALHFFDRLQAEFHHSYGPTETSIAATEWTCRREDRYPVIPIGKPAGNTQVYILDAMMRPSPIGVTGELYIGGICVGRGYLTMPILLPKDSCPIHSAANPARGFIGREISDAICRKARSSFAAGSIIR